MDEVVGEAVVVIDQEKHGGILAVFLSPAPVPGNPLPWNSPGPRWFARGPLFLVAAQLDSADLAGDGLGQVCKLDAANALEGGQAAAQMAEDRERGLAVGLAARASASHEAFGTASRTGSGAGTTAASATAGCSISTLSSSNGLMR